MLPVEIWLSPYRFACARAGIDNSEFAQDKKNKWDSLFLLAKPNLTSESTLKLTTKYEGDPSNEGNHDDEGEHEDEADLWGRAWFPGLGIVNSQLPRDSWEFRVEKQLFKIFQRSWQLFAVNTLLG